MILAINLDRDPDIKLEDVGTKSKKTEEVHHVAYVATMSQDQFDAAVEQKVELALYQIRPVHRGRRDSKRYRTGRTSRSGRGRRRTGIRR